MLLAGTLALQSMDSPWAEPIWVLGVIASWIALVFCIVRGIPVIVEAFAADRDTKEPGRSEQKRPENSRPESSTIEKA